MIVNGDISRFDLPRNVKSGLIDAQEKLKNIHQIDFVHFSAKDAVRRVVRLSEPMNLDLSKLKKIKKKQT